eukprot:3225152-Pyramimonas_sp.AAC.1
MSQTSASAVAGGACVSERQRSAWRKMAGRAGALRAQMPTPGDQAAEGRSRAPRGSLAGPRN